MNTYILLLKYTEEGILNLKDVPKRMEGIKAAISGVGGTFKDYYLTLGAYDAVLIAEIPDDITMAKMALKFGPAGHVSTNSLRAFNWDETVEIVSSLA